MFDRSDTGHEVRTAKSAAVFGKLVKVVRGLDGRFERGISPLEDRGLPDLVAGVFATTLIGGLACENRPCLNRERDVGGKACDVK